MIGMPLRITRAWMMGMNEWQPEQERILPDVFKIDRPQRFKDGQRFHGV